jgi:hypothetical protein
VAYTAGAVLEFFNGRWLQWIPGVVDAHGLFHLAVLVGAGLHWRFVWQFAAGKVPAAAAPRLREEGPHGLPPPVRERVSRSGSRRG